MTSSLVPVSDNMNVDAIGLECLVIDNYDVREEYEDLHWNLVGRFLIDKVIHFVSMQNTFCQIFFMRRMF